MTNRIIVSGFGTNVALANGVDALTLADGSDVIELAETNDDGTASFLIDDLGNYIVYSKGNTLLTPDMIVDMGYGPGPRRRNDKVRRSSYVSRGFVHPDDA